MHTDPQLNALARVLSPWINPLDPFPEPAAWPRLIERANRQGLTPALAPTLRSKDVGTGTAWDRLSAEDTERSNRRPGKEMIHLAPVMGIHRNPEHEQQRYSPETAYHSRKITRFGFIKRQEPNNLVLNGGVSVGWVHDVPITRQHLGQKG